jgi:hypothetical protein
VLRPLNNGELAVLMPPTVVVVREIGPKSPVNVNVPFAPTAFFTIWMDPVGATTWVLRNVQVVVTPVVTLMAPVDGDPLLQLALV